MRIIKLAKSEGNFGTIATTDHFFKHRLKQEFNGRFRMTRGRMRSGSPQIGEVLLFSWQGQIRYAARAATERQINTDIWRDTMPHYVEVDPGSIHQVNLSLHQLEQRIHRETAITKSIVQTQGWPEVNDPEFEARLWQEITSPK